MAFYQLFIANLKILFRNWRGVFWNVVIPVAIYVALSLLNLTGFEGIKYTEYLLPGIIAMTIMQTGIYSLAYWLIDLKERGVIKRLKVTPLSNFDLLGSLISTRILLMLVQVIILAAIGIYFFGADIKGSIVAIIILLVLGGSIFLSLGFLISSLANSYDEAAPLTTALNLIFTFLGNFFFPTSAFPEALHAFAQKLPVTYLAEGLRSNFIAETTLIQTLPQIVALIMWLVIIYAFTIWVYRVKNKE